MIKRSNYKAAVAVLSVAVSSLLSADAMAAKRYHHNNAKNERNASRVRSVEGYVAFFGGGGYSHRNRYTSQLLHYSAVPNGADLYKYSPNGRIEGIGFEGDGTRLVNAGGVYTNNVNPASTGAGSNFGHSLNAHYDGQSTNIGIGELGAGIGVQGMVGNVYLAAEVNAQGNFQRLGTSTFDNDLSVQQDQAGAPSAADPHVTVHMPTALPTDVDSNLQSAFGFNGVIKAGYGFLKNNLRAYGIFGYQAMFGSMGANSSFIYDERMGMPQGDLTKAWTQTTNDYWDTPHDMGATPENPIATFANEMTHMLLGGLGTRYAVTKNLDVFLEGKFAGAVAATLYNQNFGNDYSTPDFHGANTPATQTQVYHSAGETHGVNLSSDDSGFLYNISFDAGIAIRV